jgi:hypothetical protein
MPRKPSPTIDPAAAPEFDEQGREILPDFTLGSRTGHHADSCDALSPWGTRCTLDVHSGSHSWQGEPVPAADVEQDTLPGTPEPEQTEYDVPFEAQFNGKDLMTAPGLKAIGNRLIDSEESFGHLRGIEIRYFWRRRGGTQGGNPRYGKIKRPSVYESHFTGGTVVYLAELAADHIREAKFTPEQIEACLFSQLCKTDVDPEDHDAYRLIGPDFVGFVREIDRFGLWHPGHRELGAHIKQGNLLDQLDLLDSQQGPLGEQDDVE